MLKRNTVVYGTRAVCLLLSFLKKDFFQRLTSDFFQDDFGSGVLVHRENSSAERTGDVCMKCVIRCFAGHNTQGRGEVDKKDAMLYD